MSCHQIELVTPYHDGELPAEQREMVRQHLLTCPECQAYLSDIQNLSASFATAPVVKLSAKARARLEDALLTPPWVRLLLPVARPFAAAAMLLMAIGIPMLISSASTQSAEASTLIPASWEAETTFLTQDTSASTQSQFATWIVTDLSSSDR